jgi:hypothetical protein
MATPLFKIGFGLEDRVIALLERNNFVILHDRTLDHEFKIDFVVQSFPDNLSFESIGVQLTCFLDNREKMQAFLDACATRRKFRRCLYLEIEQGVDLEREGRAMLMTVLMNVQFNRTCAAAGILGARIFADGGYELYNLAERMKKLASPLATPAPVPVPGRPAPFVRTAKTGVLTQFHPDKGFGFISAAGTDYFFHIGAVNDPNLRDELAELPRWNGVAELSREVVFLDMGVTRKDATRPEARDVRLRVETR